jgi:hypothetical protein
MQTERNTTSSHHDRGDVRTLLHAARLVNRLESILKECEDDSSRSKMRAVIAIARESFRRCSSEYLALSQSIDDPDAFEFSVRDVLNTVRQGCEQLAIRRGLHCDFAANPRIPTQLRGEANLFSRCMQTLCAHALHRTVAGGICVRVVVDREYDGSIELRATVTDTGVGTPEDFERLRPSGPSSFCIERCRREIESTGGTFGVEHEPGRGSTSWFTMKFTVASCHSSESKSVHETHALVVGRDAEETELLAEYFDCWDIRHTPCADIEELGITLRLSSDHADLLVVGAQNNLELIEINEGVHSVLNDHPPSMIGISDDDDPESLAAARRAGIAAIINRPLEQSSMFDAVLSALTHCRIVRESSSNESEGETSGHAPKATILIDDETTASAVMFILETCGFATAILPRVDFMHDKAQSRIDVMHDSIAMTVNEASSTRQIAHVLVPKLVQCAADNITSAAAKAA